MALFQGNLWGHRWMPGQESWQEFNERSNREWLQKRGLGARTNPYAAPLGQEYNELSRELDRVFGQQAGMAGSQQAMAGGRESSTLAQQLAGLELDKQQRLSGAQSYIAARNASWDEAEQTRMQAEIARRNANRGKILGGVLSLIPGLKDMASQLGQTQSQEADYYTQLYDQLMREMETGGSDLSQFLNTEQSSYGGY